MADKIKNFDRSFPCSFALKDFFDGNGFDVKRFTSMRCPDGVFKLCNFFRRHSPNQTIRPLKMFNASMMIGSCSAPDRGRIARSRSVSGLCGHTISGFPSF